MTILLDRPFEIGDWVEVDGDYGQVAELTLRSTRIRTLSNRTVVVPNLHMINHSISNFSVRGNTMGLRVDVPFGIAYKERPAEAREVVLPLVDGDDRIASKPEPEVVVTKLNDSSVDMSLRVFIKDAGDETRSGSPTPSGSGRPYERRTSRSRSPTSNSSSMRRRRSRTVPCRSASSTRGGTEPLVRGL